MAFFRRKVSREYVEKNMSKEMRDLMEDCAKTPEEKEEFLEFVRKSVEREVAVDDERYAKVNKIKTAKELKNFICRISVLDKTFNWYDHLRGLDSNKFKKGLSLSHMFESCRFKEIDFSDNLFPEITDLEGAFMNSWYLEKIDFDGLSTKMVKSTESMFRRCEKLTSIELSKLNLSNVRTMKNMFYECRKLYSADLSGLNLDNVEIIDGMFAYCSKLDSLDLTSFGKNSKLKSCTNLFKETYNISRVILNEDCPEILSKSVKNLKRKNRDIEINYCDATENYMKLDYTARGRTSFFS